jgi:hypothetical protein
VVVVVVARWLLLFQSLYIVTSCLVVVLVLDVAVLGVICEQRNISGGSCFCGSL